MKIKLEVFIYDEKGNPYEGCLIKELENKFEIKIYQEGKIKESKTINNINLLKDYLEKMKY